jgi:hypothetical protein
MSYKLWTTEEDNILKREVNGGRSYQSIADEFIPHRSADSLRIRSRRYLNLDNYNYAAKASRIYSYNDKFWETPNLLNSYWAGFLAADGNIAIKGGDQRLAVVLSAVDKLHLLKFKNDIDYNGIILDLQKPWKNTVLHHVKLCVSCYGNTIKDLENYFSVIPNKAKRLSPPNITDDNIWAYLIGYIDGDGCICVSCHGLSVTFASASPFIINWVAEITEPFKGLRNKKRNVQIYKGYSKFGLYGEAAVQLYDFLYSFPVPKLDRKWNNDKVRNFILKNRLFV